MTRFAGSAVDFTPASLSSAGGGSNYSSAAGIVDVNNAYAAQREKAPRFDQLSATAMGTQSAEKQAAMNAEGEVMSAGIQSLGQAKASQMTAQASIKAAEAQASASKTGSMMSAVGSIGGALIGLSDETTKSDVKRIDSALEKLRNLKPVTFHYKEEFSTSPERMHHGFIAQEFQKVLPDATYFDESVGKMCIDTGDVIGLLVRANQELEARIGMLEAKQALATV
jgi:hypothetical protein